MTLSPPLDLDALYRQHAPAIVSYLRRFAGGEAEDLAADVWERVVRKAALYDPARGTFGAWLMTIAHRRGIDHLRAPRLYPVSFERLGAGWAEPHAEDHRSDPDLRHAALAALLRLPRNQRRAVYLRRYRDVSRPDTAKRLGVSQQSVKMFERRAFAHLSPALAAWREAA